MKPRSLASLPVWVFLFVWFMAGGMAMAIPERVALIPNGGKNSCLNCHVEAGGARNGFGAAVELIVAPGSTTPFWGPALATQDSDGDGFSNGAELQDAAGVWQAGLPGPGDFSLVTNPGDPASFPGGPTPTPTATPTPGPVPPPIQVSLAWSGFALPTFIRNASDGTHRLFVGEKAGRIRIIAGGVVKPEPFLDIRDKARDVEFERGLLDMVFHPSDPGKFYVTYTSEEDAAHSRGLGDLILEEYRVSPADSNKAIPTSPTLILQVPRPAAEFYGSGGDPGQHNGGSLFFGIPEDGGHRYLYMTVGEAAPYCDAGGCMGRFAKDPMSLWGKLLRLDVDGGMPYAIPPSNPFFGSSTARPEIISLGLRNPWRSSQDPETGRIYFGDVGQALYEEVNMIEFGEMPTEFGWPTLEGDSCFNNSPWPDYFFPLPQCSPPAGAKGAIHLYPHSYNDPTNSGGESVTGGYVYRGQAIPWLSGQYIYADFISSRIWALYEDYPGEWINRQIFYTNDLDPNGVNIATFGEDEGHELYAAGYYNGKIYRILPGVSPTPTPVPTPTPIPMPDAAPVADSIPSAAAPGTLLGVGITMMNLGNTYWMRNEGDTLAVTGDDCLLFLSSESGLPKNEVIAPGEEWQFLFQIRLPSDEGICSFTLQMSHNTTGVFGLPFIGQIEIRIPPNRAARWELYE